MLKMHYICKKKGMIIVAELSTVLLVFSLTLDFLHNSTASFFEILKEARLILEGARLILEMISANFSFGRTQG